MVLAFRVNRGEQIFQVDSVDKTMMFVRTVNGYMYYPPGPAAGYTPTAGGPAGSGVAVSAALTSPGGRGATLPAASSATLTTSPITAASIATGFTGYNSTGAAATPAAAGGAALGTPAAGITTMTPQPGALSNMTPQAAVTGGGLTTLTAAGGSLSTLNGALTGYTTAQPQALNGLNGITGLTAGLNGGLAAMSTTTALMSPMGAKWMLPGWSPFGLRFPLVRISTDPSEIETTKFMLCFPMNLSASFSMRRKTVHFNVLMDPRTVLDVCPILQQ